MTVQISVTVWTIICFLALMLILDRLLFRPMLGFMDKRREKIEGARTGRAAARREWEQERDRRLEAQAEAKKKTMTDAASALEELREENERRIAEKKAENQRQLELRRAALAEESARILSETEPRAQELAEAFAARIQTWHSQKAVLTSSEEIAAPYVEPASGETE